MSDKSQLVLHQSTTREAQTPPTTSTTSISTTTAQEVKQEYMQRLDLYNSLFGHGTNTVCAKTGLQLTSSLNYSLQTFLYTSDVYWVLAIININGLDKMNEKYGTQDAKIRKLHQIGTVIKDFCANDPRKLKGFKCNDLVDNDNSDDDEEEEEEAQKELFSILMYCHPKLNKSEKYISKLMKKIKLLTNETVTVGIAKMNKWETFEQWKQRGLKNIENGTMIGTTTRDGTFYSDINVKYVDPNQVNDQDEKTQQTKRRAVNRMGNKEEFEKKMQEIANNEDYEWIGAIMKIDDFDSFVFSNQNGKEVITSEIDKMKQEMYYLFDIFGNGANKNKIKYFGYQLNDKGSKYGIILYDSKDTSKCYIPGHEILETLKEEISVKCQFTVSIGSSRLIDDDLGIKDDWIDRINDNATRAEKNGGNQVCFGSGDNNESENTDGVESKVNDDESDAIETKSLKKIEEYGFAAVVDTRNIKIVANSGNLVKENETDTKCDFDPTTSFVTNFTTKVTYKQIFYETIRFIAINNGRKPYLSYPQIYLNNNKPKCDEKKHCKQCSNTNDSNSNYNYNVQGILCETKRRQVGHKLFEFGQIRDCMTDSLSKTARQLLVPDNILMRDSNEYKLRENWFVKVYSFLKWYQEAATALLENLVGFNSSVVNNCNNINGQNVEPKRMNSVESFTNSIPHSLALPYFDQSDFAVTQVEDSLFFQQFDLLTLLHSYLDGLIEYLILYYCCFKSERWISVFYPFIEVAIGTAECDVLFAESHKSRSCDKLVSLCGEVLELKQEIYNEYDNYNYNNKKEIIRKEVKGILIFQKLLCDTYETKNDVADHDFNDSFTFNPFDLVVNIGVKLNETVNNIKTQLMIQRMASISMYESDVKDTLDNVIVETERKDDWVIDENEMDNYHYNLPMPSFIRLFVIRRIISKHIDDINTNTTLMKQKIQTTGITNIIPSTDESLIQDLICVFNDNKQMKTTANLILTRLLNNGIKIYMKKCYNERDQADIIEMIFNKIILKKFANEYTQLITYPFVDNFDKQNKKDMYYQHLIYNSNDLMGTIFQYLKWGKSFDGDLFSCSLVNSCWLYHAWNPNSVYFISLEKLAKETSKYVESNDNPVIRMWQRIMNGKSAKVVLRYSQTKSKLLFNRFCLFRPFEKLDLNIDVDDDDDDLESRAILKRTMLRSAEFLKECNVWIYGNNNENVLSPLKLTNARSVCIQDVYFYRVWSNKCEKLILWDINKISQNWCQFVIEQCDCSNVTNLQLLSVGFDDTVNQNLLKTLASKFTSIGRLQVSLFSGYVDANVLLLWTFLQETLFQNDGKVELHVDELKQREYNLVRDMIKRQNLKIDVINAKIGYREDSATFIQERDQDGLKHLSINVLDTHLINDLSFDSINTLEINHDTWKEQINLNDINNFLQLDKIINKQLFIIIEKTIHFPNYSSLYTYKSRFSSMFSTLCQNLCNLIVKQIPIDIKITIDKIDETIIKQCLQVYRKYFKDDKFLSEYNEPGCNKSLCVPRSIPYSFCANSDDSFTLKVANVKYEK